MNIMHFNTGPLYVNTYLVFDGSGKAFVVDPGGPSRQLEETIGVRGLDLEYIILTHGHCDHIGGVARMKKDLPVMFVSGDCDPVGDYGKGVIRSYKSFLKAGMTDVTMKLYHGGRHEMLNEINKDEVYQDILGWINVKIGR